MILADTGWAGLIEPSGSLLRIMARGSLIYLALFAALRVMRRQAGAIGISDVLVIVLLADASQNGMAGEYTSVTEGLVLVATILFWDFAINWLAYRNRTMRRLLQPSPLLLVVDGRVQERALRRQMLTREDLLVQLREHGVESVERVRRCRLEGDGHISVLLADSDGPEADGLTQKVGALSPG